MVTFQRLVLFHSNWKFVFICGRKVAIFETSLTGSAASLLKNTTLSANNFQKSWEALNSFYENKLLVNAALTSFLNMKRMRESAAELEKLYTFIMQTYKTMESLERPVQSWDDFLILVTVHHLDSESIKAWEQHLGSSKNLPTWTQFTEFLVSRLMCVESIREISYD